MSSALCSSPTQVTESTQAPSRITRHCTRDYPLFTQIIRFLSTDVSCLSLIVSKLQACGKPSHSPHIEAYHSTDKVRILKLCSMPLLVLFFNVCEMGRIADTLGNVVKGTKREKNLEILHSKLSFMDESKIRRKQVTS